MKPIEVRAYLESARRRACELCLYYHKYLPPLPAIGIESHITGHISCYPRPAGAWELRLFFWTSRTQNGQKLPNLYPDKRGGEYADDDGLIDSLRGRGFLKHIDSIGYWHGQEWADEPKETAA